MQRATGVNVETTTMEKPLMLCIKHNVITEEIHENVITAALCADVITAGTQEAGREEGKVN